MAKVLPYHTLSMEYAPDFRNVYHNRDDCEEGKKIDSHHRMIGNTDDKPLCEKCRRIEESGQK